MLILYQYFIRHAAQKARGFGYKSINLCPASSKVCVFLKNNHLKEYEEIKFRCIYTMIDLGKLQWQYGPVSCLVQIQNNKTQCNNDNDDNKNRNVC